MRKRLDLNRIGFGASEEGKDAARPASEFLNRAETQDFIKYGFEPEFVGRLPVRVACEELVQEDLAQILVSSEGNALEQYRRDFEGYDIKFDIDHPAIQAIAKFAAAEKPVPVDWSPFWNAPSGTLNLSSLPPPFANLR